LAAYSGRDSNFGAGVVKQQQNKNNYDYWGFISRVGNYDILLLQHNKLFFNRKVCKVGGQGKPCSYKYFAGRWGCM
jgi:hypothetical protein